MPKVVLAHPIGGTPLDSVLAKLDAATDEILAKLVTPVEHPVAATSASAERIEFAETDEWGDLQRAMLDRRWGDGLPLVPPTEARVRAMLRHADGPPDRLVGTMMPRAGTATLETIAVNAVMAGCAPAHFPLLVAVVEALIAPEFNLYGVQATTHPVAPLLIVNGPLAPRLGLHAGHGVFGPGPWSNGPIGRAVRLMLLNIGGAHPGEIDKSTFGNPAKFSYCIAENEAESPWASLARERGFDGGTSTVTVVGAEAPHNVNDHESTTGSGLLAMIAGTAATTGQNDVHYHGQPLVLLSPEHAATIAGDGFSKDDVKRIVYRDSQIPLRKFSAENIERRFYRKWPERYGPDIPLDALVPIAARWEDLVVVVAGGPGKHAMYVPTFGSTRTVTRPIRRRDGSDWRPEDLER